MKKIFIAMVLLLVVGLTACVQEVNAPIENGGAKNAYQGSISSNVAPSEPVKADSSSVLLDMPSEVRPGETATATIVNNSAYEVSYGANYSFQYHENGAWVDLSYKEGKERMWIAIAYITRPGEEAKFDFVIYPDEFTAALQPGEYRLVKNVSSDNGGASGSFEIAGDFAIK